MNNGISQLIDQYRRLPSYRRNEQPRARLEFQHPGRMSPYHCLSGMTRVRLESFSCPPWDGTRKSRRTLCPSGLSLFLSQLGLDRKTELRAERVKKM